MSPQQALLAQAVRDALDGGMSVLDVLQVVANELQPTPLGLDAVQRTVFFGGGRAPLTPLPGLRHIALRQAAGVLAAASEGS